jgi:hypothetical protein
VAAATTWRLRYRVGTQRYSVTVKGSKATAVRRLRELPKGADEGAHVAPDKITIGFRNGSISRRVRLRRKRTIATKT